MSSNEKLSFFRFIFIVHKMPYMKNYVHGYSKIEANRLNDQADSLAELIHHDTVWEDGSLILEAGCGVGAQTKTVAPKNPKSKFISIDISQDSLDEAKSLIQSKGIGNVVFRQADIFNLPFEEEYFDHIFLCFVFKHLRYKILIQLLPLVFILLMAGCTKENDDPKYLRWVGDITFDAALDDPAFELCRGELRVKQYFNFSQGLQYEGEKRAIVKVFQQQYQSIENDQSGWIRIRFIVNCKGETDRFRLMGADQNYDPMNFDKRITEQLLAITRSLNGWKILPNEEKPWDYYQYLIFKIENGQLKEILP